MLSSVTNLFTGTDEGETVRDLARIGDIAGLRKLLENSRGLVYAADQDGYIPLICAAMEGHLEAAKMLLHMGGNLNHETKFGYTALSYACANGHTPLALMLLDKGSPVNHEDHDKGTPLTLACAGGHTKTAALLLDRGANIHHEAKHGRTAITYACNWGRTETVLMLLSRGANINQKTKDGSTPLARACANGHIDTAIILAEMGADLSCRDQNNKVPLDHIADPTKREIVKQTIETFLTIRSEKDKEAKIKEDTRMEAEANYRRTSELLLSKDRFRYLLRGVLAGGRVTPRQMTLLREAAEPLVPSDITDIFTEEDCPSGWDKLTWMQRKTAMEAEELANLKKYVSCRSF